MSSLLETLTKQLTPDTIGQLSQAVGADQGAVSKAIPGALAALTGGLSRNASGGGAEALLGALAKDHDGSLLDNLGGFLGGGGGGRAANGDGILGHILGGKRGAVEQTLGQASGLDSNSMGKLMAMLAPMLMGALGRQQRSSGLDAGGLTDLLSNERRSIEKQAPSGLGGLGSLLDADGDGSVVDDVARMGAGLFGKLMGGR